VKVSFPPVHAGVDNVVGFGETVKMLPIFAAIQSFWGVIDHVQVAELKTISIKSDAEVGILGYTVTFLVPLEMIAPVD
jgi:hypothetical protein